LRFLFYPQIGADCAGFSFFVFDRRGGRDECLLVRGQADACPSWCSASQIIGWQALSFDAKETDAANIRRHLAEIRNAAGQSGSN
jgi:hypothetical protein